MRLKTLVFGAAVLSVVALGSAQLGGLNQDVVDQAADSTTGEYREQVDEATRNVASRLEVGTRKEVVVKGQEHTFEAVFVEENQESAVITVDGETESVEVGDEVVVSGTEFEISSLEREGPRSGTIEVRASAQGGDIEFGETEQIQDETGGGDTESGDTSAETPVEEASDGSAGTGQVSPAPQPPRGETEPSMDKRLATINRRLNNLASVVERQQDRIRSLEDRVEQLENGEAVDQQPSNIDPGEAVDQQPSNQNPGANTSRQATQDPEPRVGTSTEEGLISSIGPFELP